MNVRFLLVCEGSSDAPLVSHIERLLIECGASEADGSASYRGGRVEDKIQHGLQYYGEADLLLVHRDADKAGAETRYREIATAVSAAGYTGPWVGLVPVRAMEAWLLVDEDAIRRVAGRPSGTVVLALPSPQEVETIADPKEMLRQVLIAAGAPQGVRRRKKFTREFGERRRQLAENLATGGSLERVAAWVKFREDVTEVVDNW